MAGYKDVFFRKEKKYMITQHQFQLLSECFHNKLKTDQYGKHTICNLYFDTPDFQLIQASIEKPLYKEKLRLRSYGIPKGKDPVFLELKKKYDGIVFKRRVSFPYQDAVNVSLYTDHKKESPQIWKEIDWVFHYYQDLRPRMYLSYDRTAMFGISDTELRITFDSNILWRDTHLSLSSGVWGTALLRKDQMIMEIKMIGAMPLWLSQTLAALQIYPISFSKYGRCYQAYYAQRQKGGSISA